MDERESTTLLSYGTEVNQFFVNYFKGRYWLTQIRRDTKDKTKMRIQLDDYNQLRDIFDEKLNSVIKKNVARSDVYTRTPWDAFYKRKG